MEGGGGMVYLKSTLIACTNFTLRLKIAKNRVRYYVYLY